MVDNIDNTDKQFIQLWGPFVWEMIHYTIHNSASVNGTYSKIQLNALRIFFTSLSELLPCQLCQQNFKKEFKMISFRKLTKKRLEKTLYNLHLKVNIRVSKEIAEYDYKKTTIGWYECNSKYSNVNKRAVLHKIMRGLEKLEQRQPYFNNLLKSLEVICPKKVLI